MCINLRLTFTFQFTFIQVSIINKPDIFTLFVSKRGARLTSSIISPLENAKCFIAAIKRAITS